MAKLFLFQWTGWISGEHHPSGRRQQVSCAAVAPSKAAFKRLTDTRDSEMVYVSVRELDEGTPASINRVAQAAINEPGTVYWQSKSNPDQTPLVHPEPKRT